MDFSGIRRARKAANLSQNELADILGINRATVSKYESGQIELRATQKNRTGIKDRCVHHDERRFGGEKRDGSRITESSL